LNPFIKKVSVAHVITSLDSGGAEKMLLKLIKQRIKLGFTDIVIVLKGKGVIQEKYLNEGIKVFNLNISGVVSFLKSFYTSRKLIKKYNIDLIQSWLYHADFYSSILSLLTIKPIIWNVRCSFVKVKMSTGIIIKMLRILSFLIPVKIIYASFHGRKTHEKFGFNRKIGLVIPNGFEKINYESIIPNSQINSDSRGKIVIGNIGRFHSDKDYLNLIKAAKIILQNRTDILFVLIGNGLDTSNLELLKMLDQNGVRENFILLGYQEEVNRFYQLFNIFCLSSKSEGYPNVLGEALLNGIPVVSTAAGDSDYIVGDSGIVVPIENPLELAKAIDTLCDMEENERIAMGVRGKERMARDFSIEKIVEIYNIQYQNIIK
jgi:glycosyltransferase involved in cell wall biosynthesis